MTAHAHAHTPAGAEKAWDAWPNAAHIHRDTFPHAAFIAGYAAGAVESLTEAADAASVNFVFGAVQLKFADWLRDRAAAIAGANA